MSITQSMSDEDLAALDARLGALRSYGEVLIAGVAVEDLRCLVAEVLARRAWLGNSEVRVQPNYDDQPPLACCAEVDER